MFLRGCLQELFPPHYRFSTGAVTDASGGLSGQVDIIVEYPFSCSFPMPGGKERLILAESVLAAIEVKSNLTRQWDEVMSTTGKLKELERRIVPIMMMGSPPAKTIPVFAVGYGGHKKLDGLKKRLETTPPEKRPDAALVIESGCYVGPGIEASGPAGLYAMLAELMRSTTQLLAAYPEMLSYLM